MSKQEKLILYTLAAVNFTNIMDFMIMMPLGPQLMRLFDITPQQFGIIVSSYTFSAGVSGFFAAFVIDRIDRKRTLTILYIGFIIGTLLCGIAWDYHFLIAARIFTGIFGGVIGATVLAIVSDVIPLERRGEAMGTIMTAFSVASVFGVPFGLYLATHVSLGWHAPFLFLGVCGIPIGYLIHKLVPSLNQHISKEKSKSPLEILKAIGSSRNQVIALILMIFIMMGHFSLIPFLSPYMVANVGFSESDLTYIYLVGGICTIFTSPIIGRMADKKGKLKIFTIFGILSLIPVAILTNLPQTPLVWALTVTAFFFIFSNGRFGPAQAMVTGAVDPKLRGSFMSISSSFQQITAGVASYIAGTMVHKMGDGTLSGYNYVGYFSLFFTIISLFIAQRMRTHDGSKY
ncbi:MAG: MFS transporter [Bacteroidia bacterium]|nr:MFS transporter [Bacteroidia bacterium]MCF8445971.1 MFS transporter [Bacteroidia bacterium]